MKMKQKTLAALGILFLTALPSYTFAQMGGGMMGGGYRGGGQGMMGGGQGYGPGYGYGQGQSKVLQISHLKNRKHGPRLLLKNISSVIFQSTN